MENVCPLCNHRVSDWQMAGDKAKIILSRDVLRMDMAVIAHKECLVDFKLRTGREWGLT